jgi:hypothetical protein
LEDVVNYKTKEREFDGLCQQFIDLNSKLLKVKSMLLLN